MSVAWTHLVDTGRAATHRAGPIFAGIAIVGAVIFSKQGMTASDALAAMAALPGLRAGLFLAWVVALAPAARVLFGTPSSLWLRSLATPPRFYAPIAAALVLLESPWVILHARGGGALAGAAALATAAGAHALLAARGLGILGSLAVAGAVTAAPGWGWLALAGALGVIAGVPAAFHAAAAAPVRARAAVAGPPLVALALAFAMSAWRGARPAWSRATVVLGAGAAATALVAGNLGLSGGGRVRLALGMAAPTLALALGGIVQAVLAAELSARWLLDATGVSAPTRAAARAAALAGVGGSAGAILGAVAAGPAGGLAGAAWGAALAAVLGLVMPKARERDDVAFLIAAGVALAFAIVAGVA